MTKKQGISNCRFIACDAREFKSVNEYDIALCLYDVVGSYPNPEDNQAIIQKAYDCLKPGGIFAMSVMNMELTESIVSETNKGRVKKNPDLLLKLKPGSIMQQTGNVFDTEHIIIDTESDVVYRKE